MPANATDGLTVLDPSPIEIRPRAWWCRASVLTAILFAAIVLNNSEMLFRSRQYEADDYAVNSLQVLKAKQFRETLGHYCRFDFHHPGPAFFYVFGWGEILFFDAIHAVPTPFNGQLIALYALSAFFFGASLALIASRLGAASPWFIGLSLLCASWHFGAVAKFYAFVPGDFGLLSPWPPCFIVLPFLCLIVAAASVATGSGKDLPLLTLAGCFLVHGHVAMPLFVGPLTMTAYGALWLDTRRMGQRPWNLYPRQHWLAAATIALFLLPIAIDFFTAHPSNLERIIRHLRAEYGQGPGLLQSSLYFLHFGAYAAYPSRWPIPTFETFDASGLLSFFLLHWRAYALWFGSILLLITVTRVGLPGYSEDPRITKFRKRMYLILAVATGLSLVWGSMQEGPLYDYNSLFNFAIYYGWLLIVALTMAASIENRFSFWRSRVSNPEAQQWRARMRIVGIIVIALAAVIALRHERGRFRAASNYNQQRLFAESVERALKLDPAQPKFLNFDWQANDQATRLAVYLERRGIRWWVREDWPLQFGRDRVITPGRSDQPVPALSSSFWRMSLNSNPSATEGDPRAIVLPVTPDVDLVVHPGK
ncbi:MAG: hypothetical protein WAO00_09650 [Chthoniobacterales bacterium]